MATDSHFAPSPHAEARRSGRRISVGRALLGLCGFGLGLAALTALSLGLLGSVSFVLDSFAHLRIPASLGALGAALILLIARWRRLAALFAVVGVAGFALLWPVWAATPRVELSAASQCRAETLTIAFANVEGSSGGVPETVAALDALDVDVLAMAELTPGFLNAASGVLAKYPHQSNADRWRKKRVISRLPLHGRPDTALDHFSQRFYEPVEIRVGGRPLGLVGAHLARPLIDRQEEAIATARAAMSALPSDRIVIGDLNATSWSYAVRWLEREAGVTVAPGYRTTWRGVYPNPLLRRRIPSIIGNQIDHVLTSPGIGVREVSTFPLPGSVHEGLRAVLEIPSAACGALPATP